MMPSIEDLITEAREWAKYDPTGASVIVGALADALECLSVPAEVEWEYALMQGDVPDEIFDSMSDLADYYGIRFHGGEYPVLRIKAGPWVPVALGGGDQ